MDLFNRKRVANLEEAIADKERLLNISQRGWIESNQRFAELSTKIAVHSRALGRIIAKLDPMFAEDEMSPSRKAESDKIADLVMRKLLGEHLASTQNTGER